MSGSRWFAGLLLAAVLAVSGCAPQAPTGRPPIATTPVDGAQWATAGCAAPRSPVVTYTAGASMPVAPPQLETALRRLDTDGPARFPASFAGVEVDHPQVRVVVYRVASADFDAFVAELGARACVVVRDAAHPAPVLAALRDRISADLDLWAGRGILINSVAARHDGSGVEVGTQEVARARAELSAHYGPTPPIVVVEQGPIGPVSGVGRPVTSAPPG